jgi:hypothetical protein
MDPIHECFHRESWRADRSQRRDVPTISAMLRRTKKEEIGDENGFLESAFDNVPLRSGARPARPDHDCGPAGRGAGACL